MALKRKKKLLHIHIRTSHAQNSIRTSHLSVKTCMQLRVRIVKNSLSSKAALRRLSLLKQNPIRTFIKKNCLNQFGFGLIYIQYFKRISYSFSNSVAIVSIQTVELLNYLPQKFICDAKTKLIKRLLAHIVVDSKDAPAIKIQRSK